MNNIIYQYPVLYCQAHLLYRFKLDLTLYASDLLDYSDEFLKFMLNLLQKLI